MTTRLSRADRILIAGLASFALFFRLATLMMIHTGVDERDYWFSAKAIARGLPYPELSHRTTRFSVILPVALAQAVLGSHPDVYYVLPVLNSMVQAALAFAIGRRLQGRITGFLAASALTLFPYMIRAGSQVRPEIFSVTYVLLALFFFMEYMEREQKRIVPLFWSAIWLFAAYEAKITNIYFLPGLLIAILAYKKKPADALILCAVLLALFLAETGAYAAFTPYKRGELEIILTHHLRGGGPLQLRGFADLFQRYSSAHLEPYWQVPFALFAVAAAAYLIGGVDRKTSILALTALGFFAGITFQVAGFRPLTPAEPFINRYFTAVLGPVFLVLGRAVEDAAARIRGRGPDAPAADSARPWIAALCAGAAAVLVVFSVPGLPDGIRKYANSPLDPARHPLAMNERYRLAINRAFTEGVPFVAVDTTGGRNALETCLSYYLSLANYSGGGLPEIRAFTRGGSRYLVSSPPGREPAPARFLAAMRSPFRVAEIGEKDLPGLAEDAYAGGPSPHWTDGDDVEDE